jgi:hypothetical protein
MMKGENLVWISVREPGIPLDPETIDELDRRFSPDRRERRATPRPGMPQYGTPYARQDCVDIILYISENSVSCGRATTALQALLTQFPPDGMRVRIVDVALDVDSAIDDRVLFTPTLIVTDRQQRKTRVLGDLSNTTVLWELLVAAGIEPR